jgi:2-hydroxychromene-2-carboxylate isomerase
MANGRIEFFFDYSSPYAYLGSLRIESVAARHGAEILWIPVVLGGIFQARGVVSPFLSGSSRAAYTLEDLKTLAAYYQIPYKPRTEFIVKSILPLRATLLVPQGPERARAVHALFDGAWAQDLDLGSGEIVTELLNRAGFDGAKLVAGTQQQSIKEELKRNTDEALARGVFGTPTMIVDGTMFWGHDRMDVLDWHLGRRQVA